MKARKTAVVVCLLMVASLFLWTGPIYAKSRTGDSPKNEATQSSANTEPFSQSLISYAVQSLSNSKRVTTADRKAAAARAEAAGLKPGTIASGSLVPTPGGTPDYFGPYSNYANSPLPAVVNSTVVTSYTTFYFAEGTCRPNFDPYITIQNPGGKSAKVTITYMKGNGTTAIVKLTVPKYSRSTVQPRATLGTGDDAAHDFSTKVECTNGQSIVAERPMYFNFKPGEKNWNGGHDVVGAIAPASTFYFAEGTCRPNFDPYITIQNPGKKSANVKITYMKGDGTTAIHTLTVPKNSRSTVEPRATLGTGDDAAHDFSAKVECTNGQKIVAERPMYFNYKPGEKNWNGGDDVVGSLAPAAAFYFAEGTCRPNFDPYITIQNPGNKNANVTITYMKVDGNTATYKLTVAKNSRATVEPRVTLGTGDDAAHDFSASVECTNGQKIVAERPMYFNYKPGQDNWNGGHDVVGATDTSSAFYFAEGTCRPNFDPYITIQNPGSKNAKVKITYMKGDGTTAVAQIFMKSNSRSTVQPRATLGTGDDAAHDFSAVVESTTKGQGIVAERPMYFNYKPGQDNWNGGHDTVGFPLSASATTVQEVVPGTGIRKFVDSLPGLGAANANDLGQYIPVAVPDKTTYPGSDYYEIELGQYAEKLHKDLPATTLRGYRQTNTTDPTVSRFSYLGPLIIAQKDRPVRVKFTNNLPIGAGGDLFIPVDTTVMGAGMGPNGMDSYTQNRAVIHLHGGNTPWISDGTMHQWITPAGESTPYPTGVSVQNVPGMPDPGAGSSTFYYTNQQSARLMFYHDHAYGITRLNVYAGEAAGYIVQDSAESALVNSKVIPADQIPLIIQDKTFVPDDAQLAAQDPTWDTAKYGGKGNLWLPHVYMPNQNPGDVLGANAMGRWDYGPWFWPPFTGLVNGPVANPYYDPVNAPWEPPTIPGTPNPSIVPEAFMDTPLVNGTAYPFVQVGPKAYRFRILNASNDRTLNLQLYFAKSDGTMWDSKTGTLADGNAGEVNMVPADPGAGLPARWPTDGRDGGVPDPKAVGPNMVQIGTEGGFLPEVAELPNTPVGYEYFRRSITVLNVSNKTLFLGPAERADVIVDFSKVPDGSKLILYNDAPAPVPAFDSRYDYYTGDPDQTSNGGAPSTVAGYGPNTRTIMQIRVSSKVKGGLSGFNLNNLKAALPAAYAQYQSKPIVPQAAYNKAFNANYPADAYARIQDTSMSFFPGPLTNLTLTNGGSGYTSAPLVGFSGGGGTGAAATAQISGVTSVSVTDAVGGYTSAPTVFFSGGGGTGAAATAQISGVTTIAVTNGGSGYTSPPTVDFTDGGGSGATAVAILTGGSVTGVTVTNGGSGYAIAPTIGFTGGGGTGAVANATVAPGFVTGIIVTNSGSGYATPPGVTFSSGSAAATAAIQLNAVTGLILTNPGSGYTSAPAVSFTGGGGSNAAAVVTPVKMTMQPKAIQELFDPDYGRMNATLGVELPNTNNINQTTIPYANIDPPSEVIKNSDAATPIGALADGTQIWKITHNGVDTHAIHWHMFNVQLINRVGWDGMVKPPDANELGWKETVRMNPLEDAIVALRPIIPNVPFDLPNSNRPLDPTMPLTSTHGFTNIDPSGQPATVTNHVINYGWEYVWHCHLLGHEENDMMRPMAIAVAPKAPLTLTATDGSLTVNLQWVDNSLNEKEWTIQRATDPAGPWTTLATVPTATENTAGSTVTYTDGPPVAAGTYYYRVIASNVVGDTTAYVPPAAGYNNMTVDSAPSNTATVTTTP
jgi:FtsP/CotA-like multicopper oxidase with cupredoxin domain